jgi:hypothetical protein
VPYVQYYIPLLQVLRRHERTHIQYLMGETVPNNCRAIRRGHETASARIRKVKGVPQEAIVKYSIIVAAEYTDIRAKLFSES